MTASDESDAAPGRIRIHASAAQIVKRVPDRYASVQPDGDDNCIVITRGAWSRHFVVWMALFDEPIEVLGPPELRDAARTLATRLSTAAD